MNKGSFARAQPIHLFFAVNYFAQGMIGVVYQPIAHLLKEGLGLSAGQSAAFLGWMTLPFLAKPLFGLATDLAPVGGLRRRPYLIAASGLAAAGWLILALQPQWAYWPLLGLLIAANIGIVACDVVCDGVMVEQGQARRLTGRYQSIQIGALYASLVLTGVGGGWLASQFSVRWIFALAALPTLAILMASRWIGEQPMVAPAAQGASGLGRLFRERTFWALCLLIFLWSFSPFAGTAQFYYQSQVLDLSPTFIGLLSTAAGICGVMGAGFYGRAIGRLCDTQTAVKLSVLLGAPVALLSLVHLGPVSSLLATGLAGFAGVAFRLALMDLASQSCPKYAEATAFALYMAVFNLAASASNTAGGWLYDWLSARLLFLPSPAYGAIAVLGLIGAFSTLCCWWVLPWTAYGTMRRAPK